MTIVTSISQSYARESMLLCARSVLGNKVYSFWCSIQAQQHLEECLWYMPFIVSHKLDNQNCLNSFHPNYTIRLAYFHLFYSNVRMSYWIVSNPSPL